SLKIDAHEEKRPVRPVVQYGCPHFPNADTDAVQLAFGCIDRHGLPFPLVGEILEIGPSGENERDREQNGCNAEPAQVFHGSSLSIACLSGMVAGPAKCTALSRIILPKGSSP